VNAIDLWQLGLEAVVLALAIGIGRRRPLAPLIAFAWVAPYLGGNFIGGFYSAFAPARALGLGIAVLVVTDRGTMAGGAQVLRKRVYTLLAICAAAGLIGVALVYARAEFIDQWRQAPPVRVLRATGAEVMRWLLLIAPAALAARTRSSRKLIRHAIIAGLCYCALALLQFGMEQTISYDPFPIARENVAGPEPFSQSAIGAGLEGRINGVCGEPRYLAAYCALWFLLTATLGERAGLSRLTRLLAAGVFLTTAVLSGSRTGLLILVAAGLAGGAAALFSGRLRLAVPILTIASLLGGTAGILILMQVGSFGARNNSTNLNDAVSAVVGGVRLPIEWQDVGGVTVMLRNPWHLVTGMGPGLWQYYENPWDHELVRTYFTRGLWIGLDSVKPNLQLVTRLCDSGLAGLCAMVAALAALYRYGKAGTPTPLRAKYLVTFAVLAAVLQLPGMADQLAFLMTGAAVQAYRELGPRATINSGSDRGAPLICDRPTWPGRGAPAPIAWSHRGHGELAAIHPGVGPHNGR
jgi:hypothetical protein